MRFIYLIIIALYVQGCCCANTPYPGYKGVHLYYHITDMSIELMRQDTVSNKAKETSPNKWRAAVLDTTSVMHDGESMVFRIKFKLKPDKDKGRSKDPYHSTLRCSEDKINKLRIKLTSPGDSDIDLTSKLTGLDQTMYYRYYKSKKDTYYIRKGSQFKSIEDFLNKFNTCHGSVGYHSMQLEYQGLFFNCPVPVPQNGVYKIQSEMQFADSRIIKNEIAVRGKVK